MPSIVLLFAADSNRGFLNYETEFLLPRHKHGHSYHRSSSTVTQSFTRSSFMRKVECYALPSTSFWTTFVWFRLLVLSARVFLLAQQSITKGFERCRRFVAPPPLYYRLHSTLCRHAYIFQIIRRLQWAMTTLSNTTRSVQISNPQHIVSQYLSL